jgi:clan AA aspartic protease (TIGR02281 family)
MRQPRNRYGRGRNEAAPRLEFPLGYRRTWALLSLKPHSSVEALAGSASSHIEVRMQRAIWIIAILLLPGCGAVPQQPLTLPAPLEGETVEQGHLCNPRALTEAITHKYPSIDPATAHQETNHLLFVFGCGPPAPAPPSFAALSAPDLRASTKATPYKAAAEPPFDRALLNRSTDEVTIERHGNTYTVPVRINGTITLPFILDTGADELAIPADVALTLIRAGALTDSDFVGKGRYAMANGAEQLSDRVILREVQVGEHTVKNVTAVVNPSAGDPLLGQSFLSKFGTVTLDYKRLVLVLAH